MEREDLGIESVRKNGPHDIVDEVDSVEAKTNDGFCCSGPYGRFQ